MKIRVSRKISTLKCGTHHSPGRYLQGEERETVEHKLKILKREIKHIIEKLTNWEDFVFADPPLSYGTIRETYAHCTHLQIAQSHAQTEICKRVQFIIHTK